MAGRWPAHRSRRHPGRGGKVDGSRLVEGWQAVGRLVVDGCSDGIWWVGIYLMGESGRGGPYWLGFDELLLCWVAHGVRVWL